MNSEDETQTFNIYQTNTGYTPRWLSSLKANSLESALDAACKKYPDIKRERLEVLADDEGT